jgi:hypothetical protein
MLDLFFILGAIAIFASACITALVAGVYFTVEAFTQMKG